MKKVGMLALTVVLVMMGLSANAQTRFGVLGGFTSSNSSVKEFTAKSSFTLPCRCSCEYSNRIYFSYSTSGALSDEGNFS